MITFPIINRQGVKVVAIFIKFYATSRDSLHEGTTKPFYQMIGQVDLISGLKTTEENSWGSVKALYL